MAEVCREEVPKLCSRLLISRETRPCSTHGKHFQTKCYFTFAYEMLTVAFLTIPVFIFSLVGFFFLCSSSHFTESYLSISPDMTIEFMPNPTGTPHLYGPSSAFKLRYEFLDTMLGGAPLELFPKATGPKAMPEPAALLQTQSKSCNRVYR